MRLPRCSLIPYARSRESLLRLAASTIRACEPWPQDGVRQSGHGGPAMPTMGAYIQLLPRALAGRPYRSTDGTVFSVIEGSGRAVIGERQFRVHGPRHLRRAVVAALRVVRIGRDRAVQFLGPAGAACAGPVARGAAEIGGRRALVLARRPCIRRIRGTACRRLCGVSGDPAGYGIRQSPPTGARPRRSCVGSGTGGGEAERQVVRTSSARRMLKR